MAYDVPQLLGMSQNELDELFKKSSTGEIPNAKGKEPPSLPPEQITPKTSPSLSVSSLGRKVFDAKNGVLRNKICSLALTRLSPRFKRERVGWTARNA